MDSLQLNGGSMIGICLSGGRGILGAEVYVQSANGNDAVQVRQAENLLTQGVDVLVVVPHNGQICASIVDSAKRENIPVVATTAWSATVDVDFYVSYDNVKVGQYQAQYLLKRAPKGNYVLIGGSPTDNNAHLFSQRSDGGAEACDRPWRCSRRRRPVGEGLASQRSIAPYRKCAHSGAQTT